MKTYLLLSALVLMSFQGCDRSKGKGSDIEWQQRQEEIERQQEDMQQLREREVEERNREVNLP